MHSLQRCRSGAESCAAYAQSCPGVLHMRVKLAEHKLARRCSGVQSEGYCDVLTGLPNMLRSH
jgi:hypothetical protein